MNARPSSSDTRGNRRVPNDQHDRRTAGGQGTASRGSRNIATRFADEAKGHSRQAGTAQLMLGLRGRDTPGGPKTRPLECYSPREGSVDALASPKLSDSGRAEQ